ncbi:MAG: trigger factor [Gammaproteobacteria bacterium]|nr:trigger factor [Gammaproteobacteria bacterium]MYK82399.1 trigger factor [Gammaproteobacteria bacterium]
MQVSVEVLSGVERRLTIVVPSDEFEDRVAGKLLDLKNNVRLPGFRPGKVPLKEVRRRFGSAVRADAADETMRASYEEAVLQESLTPVSVPRLEAVKAEPGVDLEFTASFEVLPEVELVDLAAVEVQRPEAEITDADVDSMLENLREQQRTWHSVERAAVEGDRVQVDFEGRLDGEAFDGGSGDNVPLVLGAGQMGEDFDNAVTGLEAGAATSFDAAFADDHPNETLRGRTVRFDATVKLVEEPRLPELDEAFFESMGVKEGGLPAFREEVTGNMRREMEDRIQRLVVTQVMDELNRLHSVQLPPALVDREIQARKEAMLNQFAPQGRRRMDPSSLPDELFRDQVEKEVAVGLVTRQIRNAHDLKLDDEAVRVEVERLAESYAEPEAVARSIYQDEGYLNRIEERVAENQVVAFILDQAKVNVLKSTYQDIVTGQALPPPEDESSAASPGEQDGGGAGVTEDGSSA